MDAGDGEADLVGGPVDAHGGALAVDGLQGDARAGRLAAVPGAGQAGAQVVVGQEQGAQGRPGAEGGDAGSQVPGEGVGPQARVSALTTTEPVVARATLCRSEAV